MAVLLERERELESIGEAVAAVAAGESRMLVVEGRAGIGKSRLLAELASAARGGGLAVHRARGSELEAEFPFGVVRQLFEPRLTDAEVRKRWLLGAARLAGPIFAGASDDGESGEDAASFAALHGLFWLTVNAASEAPLLLEVDDLHWADAASLRYLAYVSRRLEGQPVLLAVALRTGEPGSDPGTIAEIAGDPAAVVVRPAPITPEGASELIRLGLGAEPDPVFLAASHEATGGNPLLLRQLLRSLGDDAVRPEAANASLVREVRPRAVTRTVLLRLARLQPDAVPVARAVAVLGDGADPARVAALAHLDERRVAAAIGALARAEILRSDPPLGYVHPLVRDVVYHEMALGEREMLHREAVRLLSEARAPAQEVAAHLLLVSPRGDPSAVETLRAAASTACARGAPDAATTLLRRALAEPPPATAVPGLLLELGLVESHVDARSGTERLREALAVTTEPDDRLRAARSLAWALIFTGDPGEAARICAEAVATAPRETDGLATWLRAIELATVHFGAEVPGAQERFEAARIAPIGEGIGGRGLASIASFDWMVRGGAWQECAALAWRALEGWELFEDADAYLLGVGSLLVLDLAERSDAALAWEAALAQAHRNGSLFAISAIALWRGYARAHRGDLTGAIASLGAAHEMLRRWGIGSEAYALGYLTLAHVAAGKLDLARAAFAEASPPAEELADGALILLQAEADLLLAEGEHAEALARAERLEDRLARRLIRDVVNPAWFPWRSLTARAIAGLGRCDEAAGLLEHELERARAWGAPGAIGRSLRILGELQGQDGEATLREATTVLAGSTARLECARALAALGSTLRRARRPTEAREPLRLALATAEACGAAGLEERARHELYATGARPRRAALSGPDSLTPSEQRVAALAAKGRSNRDIAEALYVTPKTVELHLSNAYRKLDVRSRRQLPEALASTSS